MIAHRAFRLPPKGSLAEQERSDEEGEKTAFHGRVG